MLCIFAGPEDLPFLLEAIVRIPGLSHVGDYLAFHLARQEGRSTGAPSAPPKARCCSLDILERERDPVAWAR